MKTFQKTTGWIIPVWFGLLLFALCSCSVEEDPEEEITPPEGQEIEITESSKTVGSEGGTLVIDSLVLQIPPGAFSGNEFIEISVSDREHPFWNQEVTALYEARGIPADFQKPLRLVLKYNGELEDSSFLAMGMEYSLPGSDSTELFFDLVECKDSSGYLVGKCAPSGQIENTGGTEKKGVRDQIPASQRKYIKGVTGFKPYQAPNSRFRIHYSTSLVMDDRFLSLSDYLIDNFWIFQGLIGDEFLLDLILPDKVHVFDYTRKTRPSSRPPFFYFFVKDGSKPPGSGNNEYFSYTICKQNDNISELNRMIGKAFYECYQRFIFFRGDSKLRIPPDWFSSSTAVWIEEKFLAPWTSLEEYIPEDLKGLELTPFLAWEYRPEEGMAPLVKYLEKKFGTESIFDYHEAILDGFATHEALTMVGDQPIAKWFPEFIRYYMEGSLYHVPGSVFDFGTTNDYDLPEPDATCSIEDTYQDLQPRIYRFRTDQVYAENTSAHFSVSSSTLDPQFTNILVFTIDRETKDLNYISGGFSDFIEIPGIKELSDQGKDLLVVVVNSSYTPVYTRESPITLKVKLNLPFSLIHQKFSATLYHFSGDVHYEDGSIRHYDNIRMNLQMPTEVYGQFTGDKFAAVWKDDQQSYGSDSGHVYVLVSEDEKNFKVAGFDFTKDNRNSDSDSRYIYHMNGGDIPLTLVEGTGILAGKIEGMELNDRIQSLYWKVEIYNEDGSLKDGSYIIKNFSFCEESLLEVYFF